MSIAHVVRTASLAMLLVGVVSSNVAFAERDQQSGKRRGPPPEAIEACADKEEGATCSFTGRRGEATGTCFVPPRDDELLACKPEGGPPRDRDEE